MLLDFSLDRIVSYLIESNLRLSLIILSSVNPIKEYSGEHRQTQTLLNHQL